MSKKRLLIFIIAFTALIIFIILAINPSQKLERLSVNESKWNSIIENRTENKNIILEDIEFNDYNLIIDEKNNTLYYSIVNESNNKYNPNISYNTNGKNIKLAFLKDEITDEKVKSNYQFKVMIYNENEYHIYNLVCTDLPIVNINYNTQFENSKKTIPMEVYIFDNLSNNSNKITISKGNIKEVDNGYVFSLHFLTPGKNKRENKRAILNMKPKSIFSLVKIEDLSENVNIEANNHRVEFFINNEYKGVYTLIEN